MADDGPEFLWSRSDRRYRDAGGRFVSRARIRAAVDAVVAAAEAEAEAVSRDLAAGKVDLATWQRSMEAAVKRAHVACGAVAAGGRNNATPSDWGKIGAGVRRQYEFLRAFANEIEGDDLPLDGAFVARARMYASSAVGAYEKLLRDGDIDAGYREERRVLHAEESCRDCLAYAAQGWQEAGLLPDVGEACACKSNCKCTFERRKGPRSGSRASEGGMSRFAIPSPWMIRPDALPAIRAAATARPRQGLVPGQSPRPYPTATFGESGPGYDLVGGVAVIPVHGPIYRHAGYLDDLMAWAFGGVSVDRLCDALRAAAADPAARSILFSFDSPGGEAAGVGELAGMIRQAAALKPVAAYAEASCCSAAYYLAAAAGEITAAPNAIVGSIGVIFLAIDDSDYQEQTGIREVPIVSSQSPEKWPDPATAEGRAWYQALADAMADIFVDDVAGYRGVSRDHVLKEFGRGGVMVGAAAKKAGMVDRVGTLDDCLRKLAGPNRGRMARQAPAAKPNATTADAAPRLRAVLRPGRAI